MYISDYIPARNACLLVGITEQQLRDMMTVYYRMCHRSDPNRVCCFKAAILAEWLRRHQLPGESTVQALRRCKSGRHSCFQSTLYAVTMVAEVMIKRDAYVRQDLHKAARAAM